MNTVTKLLAASAVAFTLSASAQLPPVTSATPAQNVFCVGTNGGNGSTAAWAIVSPRSGNGGPPAVTTISYGTDAAAQVIRGYLVTTNNNVTGYIDSTHVYVSGATNGYATGDNLVLWHKGIDWCERGKISTVLLTNEITFAAAPQVALTNGDTIFRITNYICPTIFLGQLTQGNGGTNILVGGVNDPLMVGQAGKPFLIEVTGSSTAYIGTVAGYYANPPQIGAQPNLNPVPR